MNHIEPQRLLEMIQIGIQIEGSQKGFAQKIGVSEQYLSDILKGRREPGPKILKWFGLERTVYYRRIDGGQL